MTTIVSSKGQKKIITNDGSVQLNLNDNRLLHYDQTTYRFVIGQKSSTENKVIMSKTGQNVLNA